MYRIEVVSCTYPTIACYVCTGWLWMENKYNIMENTLKWSACICCTCTIMWTCNANMYMWTYKNKHAQSCDWQQACLHVNVHGWLWVRPVSIFQDTFKTPLWLSQGSGVKVQRLQSPTSTHTKVGISVLLACTPPLSTPTPCWRVPELLLNCGSTQ